MLFLKSFSKKLGRGGFIIRRKAAPEGYQKKFAGFIRACEVAKAEKIPHVLVAWPTVLGDTYDEVIESLWRLSDAGLALLIAGEKDARPPS